MDKRCWNNSAKYISNIWGTLEISLINGKMSLIWSWNCFIIAGAIENQEQTLTITDTKPYVPVETLSTQDNK